MNSTSEESINYEQALLIGYEVAKLLNKSFSKLGYINTTLGKKSSLGLGMAVLDIVNNSK